MSRDQLMESDGRDGSGAARALFLMTPAPWEGRVVMFVGRAPELERLLRSVRGPAHASGRLGAGHAELIGPAGIGKTRVLHELRSRLRHDGVDVELVAASSPDVAVPFAPFSHLLDLGGTPAQDPTEHLARLGSAIATRSASGTFVLLVDDAHRLDPASIELLHQTMRHDRAHVVLAARTDPGNDARLRAAARSVNGPMLELEPLDRQECGELAHELLDGPSDDHLLDELVRLSGGIPFVAVELIAAGRDAGSLSPGPDGVWTLRSELSVPPTVQDVIRERLRPLDATSRACLEMLAVADGLPLGTTRHVLPDHATEPLEALGLVAIEHSGTTRHLRLAHDLYREVLLEGPATRILAAKRAAVAALDRARADSVVELRAARLALDIDEIDTERALRCARIALRRWDPELALALAQAAGRAPAARVVLAGALGAAGRHDEADAMFVELESLDDPEVVSQAMSEHAMYLLTHRGDPVTAVNLLRDGLERRGDPDDEVLRSTLSLVLFFAGQTCEAITTAQPLLCRAGRFPPGAGPALASGWAITGNPEGVLRTWDRVWAAMQDDDPDLDSFVGLNVIWCRLLALSQLGRLQDGDDPIGAVPAGAWWPNGDAWLVRHAMPATQLTLRGHLAQAAERYDLVLDHLPHAPLVVSVLNVALMAALRAQRGELVRAREAVAWCDTAPESILGPFRWWIDRARAWITAVGGDVGTAVHELQALAARHDGEWFYVTTGLHDVVRLGRAPAVVDQLTVLADRRGATWFDTICRDHAVAATAGDATALLDVATRFEAGGHDLLALEASAQAASTDIDRPGVSAAARDRVERLSVVCGPIATPAMEMRPHVLTDRELEVSRLAARGWTNARIAGRLGTSTRTVGNQLQSAYSKLHINSRNELRPLFPSLSAPRDDLFAAG